MAPSRKSLNIELQCYKEEIYTRIRRTDMSHTRASMIDIINIIRTHTQIHIRHGNYFLLVFLWQGIAIGLDVTCPKRFKS